MNTRSLGLAILMLAAVSVTARAGTISYFEITNDATSQISTSKTYVHLFDFGQGSPGALINGVQFTAANLAYIDANPSIITTAVSSGGRNDHAGNGGHALSGGIASLVQDMIFNGSGSANGTHTITLKGLTPGNTYSTRIYTRSWDASNRVNIIDYDTDGVIGTIENTTTIDQNHPELAPTNFGTNSTFAVNYTYLAQSTELTIRFTEVVGNQSWHLYGISTEVVPVPEPSSLILAGLAGIGLIARLRFHTARIRHF